MMEYTFFYNSQFLDILLYVNGVDLLSQSWVHTRASNVKGVREVRKTSKIRPLVLKTDSEATVDIGIARISWAM
jgi:hypothetical protein